MLTPFANFRFCEEERKMRRILLLALFGFLAAVQPFVGQSMDVTPNEPVVKTDQAQWPPPPDCGLYDICGQGKS